MNCFQTPAYVENTVPMVDSYQQQQQQQQQPMSLPATLNTNTSQIDQEFTQINKQFQDLSLQYQNQSYEYANSTVETSPNQSTDVNTVNSYADRSNQYAPQNVYESHQQTDYYGPMQPTETSGYAEQQIPQTGYTEQQQMPQTGYTEQPQMQQMYQQPTSYNDLSFGAPSCGNVEVNANHMFHSPQS